MIQVLINDVKHFFIGLFSCFTKKSTRYQYSNSLEDLETTYLFESDDNINY